MQEVLFKDILLPAIKIAASAYVGFPSKSKGRRVLLYKILDVLYVISLRIGFENTRERMTYTLQKFFAAFSKARGIKSEISGKGDVMDTNSKSSLPEMSPVVSEQTDSGERYCIFCYCSHILFHVCYKCLATMHGTYVILYGLYAEEVRFLEQSLYVEIRRDVETNEYLIGQPVTVTPTGHRRQSSLTSVKLSLSPFDDSIGMSMCTVNLL